VDAVCTRTEHNAKLFDSNGNEIAVTDTHTPRFFTRVSPYVFGDEYYNITGRYVSNTLGYDATTHFYLG
jgi:hypothetical protein